MIASKHYTEADFQRCNPSCSMQDMNQGTINRLDKATDIAGFKFRLTSAARTIEHEKSKGRAGTSSHISNNFGSRAIDIATPDSRTRFKVMQGLIGAGFNRIGVNLVSNFFHADDSVNHDQDVLFTY